MAKRAIMGLRGVALAKVTTNSLQAYASLAASIELQYAGAMNRTPKESSSDLFYDDALYATVKDVLGEDVELRIAEVPLEQLEALGVGTYDETTGKAELNFSPEAGTYSLRCITDTVDKLPFYFNWRVFDLTSFRLDNFATKNSGVTVCEVIIAGTFKRPQLASVKDYAFMVQKEDGSNTTACQAFLAAGETFPTAPEAPESPAEGG